MKALSIVNYVQKGPIVVLRNTGRLVLFFGDLEFSDTRWVITLDVFEKLRKQNPDVKFVNAGPNPK
jgi:hypothetical protein